MILQVEVFRFTEKEPPDNKRVCAWDGEKWAVVRWLASRQVWKDVLGSASMGTYSHWSPGMPNPERKEGMKDGCGSSAFSGCPDRWSTGLVVVEFLDGRPTFGGYSEPEVEGYRAT